MCEKDYKETKSRWKQKVEYKCKIKQRRYAIRTRSLPRQTTPHTSDSGQRGTARLYTG